MRPPTIGARLALVNAAVVAAAMLALGGLLYALLDRALLRGADGILRDELEEVAAPLRSSPLSEADVEAIARTESAEHVSEFLAFRITGPGGKRIAVSPSEAWDLLPPPSALDPRTVLPPRDGVRHRVIARRVDTASFGTVILEASMRMSSADAAKAELLEAGILLAPLLLLSSLVAGYFLARHALLPVGRMEESARHIGSAPRGERLPRSGTGDEIDRLAGTLNAMLERIEESSARNLRFAGDVAHEVRNPLATIRARLEAIPGGGERVDAALAEVARLEATVRSLLHLCRADEPPAGGDLLPVDLGAVAGSVAGFFGPAAADRGVRLDLEVHPGLRVLGDATALERALANLVDNALHASDPGGGVTVRGARADGLVRVEVLDRGCGIPGGERGRVFERFFRSGNGRARPAPGTGLGLALVRAVARSHGGEASYAPREGGGSVFGIDLPPAEPPVPSRR